MTTKNLSRLPSIFVITFAMMTVGNSAVFGISNIYAQTVTNDTAIQTPANASQFIVNIRGISSFTEENMVAMISTENDVQVQRVDLSKIEIEPGQQNSYSPSKMVDVTISMDKPVKPKSEVTACVIQLGSTDFTQRIKCNIVYSEQANSGEPQKIIVPL